MAALSIENIHRLVSAVSDRGDEHLMDVYARPVDLYDALLQDAARQSPPYLTRDPVALYEIAVRNRWESVCGHEFSAVREP